MSGKPGEERRYYVGLFTEQRFCTGGEAEDLLCNIEAAVVLLLLLYPFSMCIEKGLSDIKSQLAAASAAACGEGTKFATAAFSEEAVRPCCCLAAGACARACVHTYMQQVLTNRLVQHLMVTFVM